jgi:hypothetical protein
MLNESQLGFVPFLGNVSAKRGLPRLHCTEQNESSVGDTMVLKLLSHNAPLQWAGDLMGRVLACNQFKPRQTSLTIYCQLFIPSPYYRRPQRRS